MVRRLGQYCCKGILYVEWLPGRRMAQPPGECWWRWEEQEAGMWGDGSGNGRPGEWERVNPHNVDRCWGAEGTRGQAHKRLIYVWGVAPHEGGWTGAAATRPYVGEVHSWRAVRAKKTQPAETMESGADGELIGAGQVDTRTLSEAWRNGRTITAVTDGGFIQPCDKRTPFDLG